MAAGLVDTTKAIESIATTGAILLGGLWTWMLFVRRRQRFPRASVTHEIEQRSLVPGRRLLHITLTVTNCGDVLLQPVAFLLRVQQVLPLHPRVESSLNPVHGRPPSGTEFGWPTLVELRESWGAREFEIEPGEADRIYCDAVIPDSIKTIEVYSHIDNATKRKRSIGWTATTLYDL